MGSQHQLIVNEFCAITTEDESFARMFLASVDYNLEEAVIRYYSNRENDGAPEHPTEEIQRPRQASLSTEHDQDSSNLAEWDSNQSNSEKQAEPTESYETFVKRYVEYTLGNSRPSKRPKIDQQVSELPSTSTSERSTEEVPIVTISDNEKPRIPPKLTIISYNVDGTEERSIGKRLVAAMKTVAAVYPDIIFLQEVIDPQKNMIIKSLQDNYNILTGEQGGPNPFPYYTVTAISKSISIDDVDVISFPNSSMGRNMLCIKAKWEDLNIYLINSHLESFKESSEERKHQFAQVMEKFKEYSSDSSALSIFGGDLNLRDTEVSNVPEDVQDVWIATGRNSGTRYTWDTLINKNKSTPHPCRCRFDRFYVRSPYQKMSFWLAGKNPIEENGLFASDHFAIVCRFSEFVKKQ